MSSSFLPTATIDVLKLRARLLAALRRYFDERGYLEVETPILSQDVIVDAWLEPFVTRSRDDPASIERSAGSPPDGELFLQTSPEFGMKRLLAAGAQAIYQITRAFRTGEAGRLHNPEFTIVEWYRVGDTHREQMDVVEELVTTVYAALDTPAAAAIRPPFERLSYDAAFGRYAGTPVLSLSMQELAALAERRRMAPPPGLAAADRDGWLNVLLSELVEPHLGIARPTILYDYPATQASLARIRPGSPPVAERFELYIRGIEICNGYHELTDPAELRRRIAVQAAVRAREGRRALPAESRLLAAMDHGLPACAGVALGLDRLLLAATGADSLAEVMAFPCDRA